MVDLGQPACVASLYGFQMISDHDHLPGERAAETGRFEELNIFGTPTGKLTHADRGERLPVAPQGFTWRRSTIELVNILETNRAPWLAYVGSGATFQVDRRTATRAGSGFPPTCSDRKHGRHPRRADPACRAI